MCLLQRVIVPFEWRGQIRLETAFFVWGYALAWFVFNDFIKLAAYKVFEFERELYGRKHLQKARHVIGS